VAIVNALGMHARAAARFSHLASRFQSHVTVSREGRAVDGKSILGLLLLSAAQGAEIEISAEGPDAEAAITALDALVSGGFEDGQGG
jgi:phosphocarrier protein